MKTLFLDAAAGAAAVAAAAAAAAAFVAASDATTAKAVVKTEAAAKAAAAAPAAAASKKSVFTCLYIRIFYLISKMLPNVRTFAKSSYADTFLKVLMSRHVLYREPLLRAGPST